MVDYVVNPKTTPPSDLTGTAFSHLDVRWLVNDIRQGAELVGVGQTIYPARGGTHEHHLHPDAEEVVIVMSGYGWHRVGSQIYNIFPGDVVFVPKNTPPGLQTGGVQSLDRPLHTYLPSRIENTLMITPSQ